jgi:23S rRNA pseudouridine1911/1915/1917 synthase
MRLTALHKSCNAIKEASGQIRPHISNTVLINNLPNTVLYEDNHVIAVNKSPGVLCQADQSQDSDLFSGTKSYLKQKYNKQGNIYLGLLHRLDRPCSGIVLMAKTSKAAGRLSADIRNREIEKQYLCIVHGNVSTGQTLENVIAKCSLNNSNYSEIGTSTDSCHNDNWREARLSYQPIHTFQTTHVCKRNNTFQYYNYYKKNNILNATNDYGNFSSLLKVNLITGRKHQIRAQLSNIGYPIHLRGQSE